MAYIGNTPADIAQTVTFGQVTPAPSTGNKGKTLISTGTGTADYAGTLGIKNRLINGNFDLWRRGTSLSAGTGKRYLADRFYTNSTGSTVAPSRQAFTLGQTNVPGEPKYFHRAVVVSSAGAGNFALM